MLVALTGVLVLVVFAAGLLLMVVSTDVMVEGRHFRREQAVERAQRRR